jgi:hypothetical protein
MRLEPVAIGIGELEGRSGERSQRAEGLRAVAEFKVEKGALAKLGEALFDSSRMLIERRGGLSLGERRCREQRERGKRQGGKDVDSGLRAKTAEKAFHFGAPSEKTTKTKAGRLAAQLPQQTPVRNNLPLNWVLESPPAVPLVM